MKFDETLKKSAFTLAEVLITLGIIGVVAAMTIPTLIANYQKKSAVTKLQKAISVLNQAYRLSVAENGEVTGEEAQAMGGEEYFNTYWAPYLKTAQICKTYKDFGYNYPQPFKYINGTSVPIAVCAPEARSTIKTMDNLTYVIFTATNSVSGTLYANSSIIVDLNGGEKPNTLGKDVFWRVRTVDGEKGGTVLSDGYNQETNIINNSCSKTGRQQYCAEKIRRAGWQIEKDYPW